jgi:chromosomal replication initiator protein
LPETLWNRCLRVLESELPIEQFNTWLRPLQAIERDGELRLLAPNPYVIKWVGEHSLPRIKELAHQFAGAGAPDVVLDVGTRPVASNLPSAVPASAPSAASGASPAGMMNSGGDPRAPLSGRPRRSGPTVHGSPINDKFTFDSFVEGKSNQLAKAAAIQVAGHPGKAYNPLFIYGGVGLGKTHLMHAVANKLKERNSDARVAYVHSEGFVSEMVRALQHNTINDFKTAYRSLDALMIDDIQFFAGKDRSQEEFFHTFNALHENMKQVVIASDRPPKELTEIEERLRSRFEWGLIADIQPPDLETKVAILQKKAESEQVQLPTDVALFIASNVRTNVRELEGALVRLIAWCQLNRMEITLAATQQCLKQFIDMQVRKITIEAIQRAVAEQFGMRVADLKQKNNSRNVVVPRQIAMYLAKQMTEASLPEIGRQFGNKHHTTVMHSIGKIDEQRRTDKDLHRTLNKLQDVLNA